jgi:glycosyltransferase involved in cell wall biosynthesis
MVQTCPGLHQSALTVVPNGYDADDFRMAAELVAEPDDPHPGEVWIVHSGTLHGDFIYPSHPARAAIRRMLEYSPERIDPSGRTIAPLLAALKELRTQQHDAVPVRIVLVGQQDDGTRRCIAESGVQDAVTCTGFVTHVDSIRWLQRADALFLPLHGLPDGARSLIVPGKTYEYLATGKPILASVPEGDARDLVSAARFGYTCAATDVQDIAATLARLVSDWRKGRFANADPLPWVARYARRHLCATLDQFLSRIASRHQAAGGIAPGQHATALVQSAS